MECTPKVRQVKYPSREKEESWGMANLRGAKSKGLAFWVAAVERINRGERAADVAAELGVDRSGLQRWERRLNAKSEEAIESQERERGLEKEVDKLKRTLAEKVLEVDFLRGALHKVEERRQKKSGSGGAASTTRSGK